MQSEIRKIIGYDVETTLLNEKGREYLKEATNPGAILAVQGVLIVASDNKTFNQDTINSIPIPVLSNVGQVNNIVKNTTIPNTPKKNNIFLIIIYLFSLIKNKFYSYLNCYTVASIPVTFHCIMQQIQ